MRGRHDVRGDCTRRREFRNRQLSDEDDDKNSYQRCKVIFLGHDQFLVVGCLQLLFILQVVVVVDLVDYEDLEIN